MWTKQEKDCVYEWNKPEGISEKTTLYGKPHHEDHHGGYGRRAEPKPPSLEKPKQGSSSDTLGSRVPINVGY